MTTDAYSYRYERPQAEPVAEPQPEYLELEQDTKAYGEGWKTFKVIPAGSRAVILDKVSDERGACIIILWEGEELAIDVNDLPWPDRDEW